MSISPFIAENGPEEVELTASRSSCANTSRWPPPRSHDSFARDRYRAIAPLRWDETSICLHFIDLSLDISLSTPA